MSGITVVLKDKENNELYRSQEFPTPNDACKWLIEDGLDVYKGWYKAEFEYDKRKHELQIKEHSASKSKEVNS